MELSLAKLNYHFAVCNKQGKQAGAELGQAQLKLG